jgi:Iron-sulfur cluster-binding domain
MCIKRMKEINYTGIVDFIFYNEPLLDPSLPDKVSRVKAEVPGCLPRVTTNGDALTEDRLISLVRAGVISFYVTRHVPTSDKWDERMAYLAQKYPQYVTVTDIMDVQKQMGLSNRAGLVSVDKKYTVDACSVPDSALTIDRFGKIPLCCCDYFRTEVQGDIMKQGILEIWRGENFQRIRRDLQQGKVATKLCTNCILRPKTSGEE